MPLLQHYFSNKCKDDNYQQQTWILTNKCVKKVAINLGIANEEMQPIIKRNQIDEDGEHHNS